MAKKHAPAREVARFRSDTDIWLDHARVVDEDLEWLSASVRLALWNVVLPVGFLSGLPSLESLDVRGGSAKNLQLVEGCTGLVHLSLNQIRGLHDLSTLPVFTRLRLLQLYGLPRVEAVPSLHNLENLSRVEIGSMKGLESLTGILAAPRIREFLVIRKMKAGAVNAAAIAAHSAIEKFSWFGEGVPVSTWKPVQESVGLPPVRPMHAEKWLAQQDGYSE